MLPPFCKLKYARYKIKFQKKIKFRSYLPTQTFLATLSETDYFFFFLPYHGWSLPGTLISDEMLACCSRYPPADLTLASFCLLKSHACLVSACFQTPKLLLVPAGSFQRLYAWGYRCLLNHYRLWCCSNYFFKNQMFFSF